MLSVRTLVSPVYELLCSFCTRHRLNPMPTFDHWLDLDIQQMLWVCVHLVIAYLLAIPIAWDREKRTRAAGIRTFPLVAVAACGFILVGRSILSEGIGEGRLISGLMTGLGFLGGGAILKNDESVIGMATAASIWATGAVGLAVAFNRYEIALFLTLVTFATLHLGTGIKETAKTKSDGEPAGGGDRES